MEDLKSVPEHAPSIVATKTGTEYVLVPVKNNIADMDTLFTLNETGAFIWDQIDGKNSIEEIIAALMKEYEAEFTAARTDVTTFIEEMKNYLIIK